MNYIYGLNKSGISIAKLLIKNKLNFCFWDDNKKVRINVKKIFKNIDFVKPKIENLIQYKNIYLTPAISIYKKKFENLRKKKLIKRDLNLYYENISKQKIIAITGTNGKSTTTKLIGDILKKNNFKTFVGG
ncbi:MAG: UDP-N-acetylmuramoylalanine--D-glutamate ligase, partial [Alphaproteobacteria bacterium MarineAlpha5_Bin5]